MHYQRFGLLPCGRGISACNQLLLQEGQQVRARATGFEAKQAHRAAREASNEAERRALPSRSGFHSLVHGVKTLQGQPANAFAAEEKVPLWVKAKVMSTGHSAHWRLPVCITGDLFRH